VIQTAVRDKHTKSECSTTSWLMSIQTEMQRARKKLGKTLCHWEALSGTPILGELWSASALVSKAWHGLDLDSQGDLCTIEGPPVCDLDRRLHPW